MTDNSLHWPFSDCCNYCQGCSRNAAAGDLQDRSAAGAAAGYTTQAVQGSAQSNFANLSCQDDIKTEETEVPIEIEGPIKTEETEVPIKIEGPIKKTQTEVPIRIEVCIIFAFI